MGPWSNPSSTKVQQSGATLGPAEWALMIGLAALVILGAVAVWCSRYELGVAGGVPTRLDRFTGQVIGCVPGQGCLELIPAGEPALQTRAVQVPSARPDAAATGNAAATPVPAPRSQPASPAPAAQGKPKG